MKILHTSDWHLGKTIHGKSLLEDQEFFINNFFIPTIKREKPNLIIISGDIFDKPIAPIKSIKIFDNIISKIKTPIAIIPGNHDSPERMAIGTDILIHNNIFIYSCIENSLKPIIIKNDNIEVNIYLVPYVNKIDNIINKIKENLNNDVFNILVAHCFVTGCSISDSETPLFVGGNAEISSKLFSPFNYVALGHLHTKQQSSKNIFYSGSPLKYSFSECNKEKSMNLIEIKNNLSYEIKNIKINPLHDMKIIKGEFKDIIKNGIKNPSKDYIMIELTDKNPIYMPVTQLRVYYPNILTLKSNWLENKSRNKNILKSKSKLTDEKIFTNFIKEICDEKVTDYDMQCFKFNSTFSQ